MALDRNNIEIFPTAKVDQIVVQDFEDETLVYDLELNKAHCLNRTAALVWRACTGERTTDQISEVISLDLEQKVSSEIVRLALAMLSERNLLTETGKEEFKRLSRRSLIVKAGLSSAFALPLILSLVVPADVMAQSSFCGSLMTCFCNGKGSNGGQCPTGNCPSACRCGNLMGCNPGGEQCFGICVG